MPAPHDSSAHAVSYCRVSSPGQASIPDQEKWARRHASESGWALAAVVKDEGVRGDTLTRPGLTELEEIFAARQRAGKPIGRLIVWATDRLSRADTLDAFEMLARLRRLGLRYVCTESRVIDLHVALDRTLLSIEQDHQNNPFLKNHGAKALRGMSETVQAGFWVGRIPLGYRVVKDAAAHGGKRRRSGKLELDPDTAPVVRELFERYAGGESTVTLAVWLTSKARPPKAARWCHTTIRQLLMSTTYIGTQTFGRMSRGKHVRLDNGQPVPKPEAGILDNLAASLVIKDAVPAIIDEATFRMVQAMLATGRRRSFHKGTSPLPLSGLGKCGSCGGTLYCTLALVHGKKGERTRRLVCSERMRHGVAGCAVGTTGTPHDPVLTEILRLLAANLLGEDALGKITALAEEQIGREQTRRASDRDAAMKESARLQGVLQRAEDALLTAPADLVENYQNAIRRAKAGLAEQAARAEAPDDRPAAVPDEAPARLRQFWEVCRRATSIDIRATGPELNDLLKELLDGFTLHFKTDGRGRSTPSHVEVELPRWLSALVSKVCTPCTAART